MSLPSLSSSFITIVILIYSFVITVVILIYFFVITIVILIHVIVILEIVSFFTKEPIHSKCNQCSCEWILKSAKVHSLQIFIQRAALSAAGSSSLPRISSPSSQGNHKWGLLLLCGVHNITFTLIIIHSRESSTNTLIALCSVCGCQLLILLAHYRMSLILSNFVESPEKQSLSIAIMAVYDSTCSAHNLAPFSKWCFARR